MEEPNPDGATEPAPDVDAYKEGNARLDRFMESAGQG